MKTEASRLFDELNRRHWRGRLPQYRVVRRERLPGGDGFTGLCLHRTRTILLKRELAGDRLRVTLLHEMAHLAVCESGHCEPRHGPRFCSELARLLALGEACLQAELAYYDYSDGRREADEDILGEPSWPGLRVRLIRKGVVISDGPAPCGWWLHRTCGA